MIDVLLFLLEDLCIILGAILVVRMHIISLKIYQDCRYHLGLTFQKNISFLKKHYIVLLLIPFIFVLNLWYMQIIFLIYASFCIKKLFTIKFIRSLKKTPRIIRQGATLLIGLTILGTVLMMSISFSSLQSLLVLYAVLSGLFVLVTGVLLVPIESAISMKYIMQAKRKLKKYKPTIIGITGSCGKTTVKNMVFELLSRSFMTEASAKSFNTMNGISITINSVLDKEELVLVLEMGATKKGDILDLVEFSSPEVGVVTEISPQHIRTFHSIENILEEKMELIENLKGKKLAVLNYDNELIRNYKIKNEVNLVMIGTTTDCTYYATDIKHSLDGISFCVKGKADFVVRTRLVGRHQITNLLCAIALALEFGVPSSMIQERLLVLRQVTNRLEIKKTSKLTVIDDSYNSNPAGFRNALEVLGFSKEKKTLITPGVVEAGSQTEEINQSLAVDIARVCDEVILIDNPSARFIAQGLEKLGYLNYKFATRYSEAREMVNAGCLLIENDLPDQYFI